MPKLHLNGPCSPADCSMIIIIVLKLNFRLDGLRAKRKKTASMADTFATPSRSILSRPLLQFLEAILLKKAADTSAYREKF